MILLPKRHWCPYPLILRAAAAACLSLAALTPQARAIDPYGLATPVAIGSFLNGSLPATTPGQGGSPAAPALLSAVDAFDDLATLTPTAGVLPYDLNAPLWSDAALKRRWLAVPNDGAHDTAAEQITFAENGPWGYPIGTVLIKHFELEIDETDPGAIRRLETRFLVHGSDGVYYGITYRWLPDGSDAELLADALEEPIQIATTGGGTRTQVWPYPGRDDCMHCHNINAGSVLGPRTHQLNRDLAYPSTGVTDNQLRALNGIGLFGDPLDEAAIDTLPRSANLTDTNATEEHRVRSYLSANCAHCHRPGGTNAYFDARYDTPLAQTNIINGPLLYLNGIADARVVAPGSIPQSMMHVRLGSLGAEQMPPVGKNVVDADAVALLAAWINSLQSSGGGGNAAPVAADDSGATAYGTAITIAVLDNDNDGDGDTLSVDSTGGGANGVVAVNPDGTLTYTPNNGFSGPDFFGYTARDPSGATSNTATVSVSVAADGADTAIGFTNRISWVNDPSVRSGVAMAIADMNGDSYDDIVRLHVAKTLKIEFQSPGGNSFSNYTFGTVSSREQWGLCVADFNDDGINDIVSGGYYDGLKRYTGNADGTWSKATLGGPNIFLQAVGFADIDGDGDVDLFACHDDAESSKYRNNGGTLNYDPSLLDTTTTPSSDNSGNYGAVWTDYDRDGDIDMYLSKCRGGVSSSSDPRRINMLFQNDGAGNYTEVAAAAGLAFGAQSWSADFADIDHDGDLDCFVGNHYSTSKLMRNNGDGTFTDITGASGISFNWKVVQLVFRDFNNDTWDDLLIVGAQHALYLNDGASGGGQTFTKVANPLSSNWVESCAVGDLNHDGFIDIYAGYAKLYNTPSSSKKDKLFINDGNANGYLAVQLEGVASNRQAIGARVELYGSWGVQVREVRAGEGYGIQHSLTCMFGLGEYASASSLVVRWPSGATDTITNPPTNTYLQIREGSAAPPSIVTPSAQSHWGDETVSLQITATDPTGDSLTYAATNLPPGLAIDPDSGLISGTLGLASTGSYTVLVSASDAFSTASTTFLWNVKSILKRYDGWAANTPGAGTSPLHNIDGDLLSDLLEFGLGADPADGNPAATGLHLDTSGSGIDALYVRPAGLDDIAYTLEISGDLQTWQDLVAPTVTGNGDTETVRYSGIESQAPLSATRGFVRLRVELGTPPTATSRTIPVAWRATALAPGYGTHGSSLPKKPTFVGRISSVGAATLTFPYGSPAAAMLAGRGHYIEIAAGPRVGHRAEVDPATTNGATVGLDLGAASSTLAAVTGDLVGVPVIIREHQTLDDLYPLAAFSGSADPAQADQIQIFTGGAYVSYFLLDAGPFLQWTAVADNSLADAGGVPLPPGQGVFVRNSGAAIGLLAIGQVRFYDFVQPLAEGFNLIAEPFPVATSPRDRGMLLGDGFFGSRFPAQSDQIQIWQRDSDPAAAGYRTLFLLDAGAGTGLQFWVDSADNSLVDRDDETLFLPDRATFFKATPTGGHPDYLVPTPWVP